jgi:hypothetical protein
VAAVVAATVAAPTIRRRRLATVSNDTSHIGA